MSSHRKLANPEKKNWAQGAAGLSTGQILPGTVFLVPHYEEDVSPSLNMEFFGLFDPILVLALT